MSNPTDFESPEVSEELSDNLGTKVRGLFATAERERRDYEDQWLKDLRQYKGVYDDEVVANIAEGRSKTFIRLTRSKVKAMDSRLMDIQFPAGSQKNYRLEATPVPDIDPTLREQVINEWIAQSQSESQSDLPPQPPTQEQIEDVIQEAAEDRVERMSKEIDDQLSELKYREISKDVIHSGNVFGTGVLKGPLFETRLKKRWIEQANGATLVEHEEMKPYFEFVPIWDIYPDMNAMTLEDCEYIIQRHTMLASDLRQLARRDDFDKQKIKEYIAANRHGDMGQTKQHEQELRYINGNKDSVSATNNKQYEVLEFWGYVDGQDLVDMGVEGIGEDEIDDEFEANVWVLGSTVIKADLNPTAHGTRPFNFYYFEKDETGIFGVGLPAILSDTQSMFNAAIRMSIDNAAISTGAQYEIDLTVLDLERNPNPTKIYPNRVWFRTKGAADNRKALNVHTITNNTSQLLSLAQLAKELGDEASTMPSYMGGNDAGIGGAGDTASGLSMLMGAAGITVKDVALNFDMGITQPAMTALYNWNMQFNSNREIKGDMNVTALGAVSLVAKEIKSKQLTEFAVSTGNPMDAPYVNRQKLNAERVKALDLPEDILYTKEESDQLQSLQQENQALMQQLQQLQKQVGVSDVAA
jgi:fructose 1,6-bisphosphatase